MAGMPQCLRAIITSMLKFNPLYFVLATVLFFIEVLIAVYAHDEIIRPYVGDILVVMLIYCFVKSFLNIPCLTAALATLVFSYAIETLQYFNIVKRLGLQNSKLARTIIGTSFAWMDILAYTLGIAFVIGVEILLASRMKPKNSRL